MKNLCTYTLAAVVAFAAAPRPADAQVYPERAKLKAKHVAEIYQRHEREDSREEQTERFTKTLRLGQNGTLEVGNIAGDITIVKGGGGDATVEVVKVARGRTVDDAKQQLPLVQVDVIDRNGRGEVRARYPHSDDWRQSGRRNLNVTVSFNITAPAGTQINVNTISGDVRITDIKGELSAASVSGDVRISGASRITEAKSVSGSIDIADTQTDGSLEAGSVSGDVTIRKVNARRLDLQSVSGNVHVEDAQCERVAAHSTSGNIGYAGALAKGGRYELKSFSGDVRVTVAGSTGFEIEASSFSGEVRPEMDITVRNTGDTARRRRTMLSGTYGDGSALLQITTFSGRIAIGKR